MNSIESVAAGMSALQQTTLKADISFAVAKKQLDAQQQMGQAAIELLESAVQLVKEAGKGSQIDSLA
jgi:hypothetical protein